MIPQKNFRLSAMYKALEMPVPPADRESQIERIIAIKAVRYAALAHIPMNGVETFELFISYNQKPTEYKLDMLLKMLLPLVHIVMRQKYRMLNNDHYKDEIYLASLKRFTSKVREQSLTFDNDKFFVRYFKDLAHYAIMDFFRARQHSKKIENYDLFYEGVKFHDYIHNPRSVDYRLFLENLETLLVKSAKSRVILPENEMSALEHVLKSNLRFQTVTEEILSGLYGVKNFRVFLRKCKVVYQWCLYDLKHSEGLFFNTGAEDWVYDENKVQQNS